MTDAFSNDDAGAEERKSRLRAALADLRAGRLPAEALPDAGAAPAEAPAETSGEAAGGQVRAVASAGRIDVLEIDAALMRRDLEEIGALCASAITGALRGQRDTALFAGAPPDLGALGDMLQGVQTEGMRAMARIEQALGAVIADVGPRTGMAGDPRALGLDNLLSATTQGLREATAAIPAQTDTERRGLGADGAAVAVIGFGGAVRLELSAELARAQSHELAAAVVQAVNAALAEPAPEAATPAADPTDLSRRMDELRDAGLAQMTAYSTALRSIMNRIGEP